MSIELHGRVSVLALGSVVGELATAHILASGSYVGGKLGYEITVQGATLNGAVTDVVLCDSAGKVKRFTDLGAALEKLRRALVPVAGAMVVNVTVYGAPVHGVSMDIEAASTRRGVQLGKMQTANTAALAAGEALLVTMAGWDALGGPSAVRYAEVLARVQAMRNDAVVIADQIAALPVLSGKPDA